MVDRDLKVSIEVVGEVLEDLEDTLRDFNGEFERELLFWVNKTRKFYKDEVERRVFLHEVNEL